ncbi:hypothetical protein [Micromonospora sp. HNM0581]|uniref:hypothetical protein n=1 Tax=Micromonospora sp. HNM0581 TaxID=2716341 RepID=UPI003216FC04
MTATRAARFAAALRTVAPLFVFALFTLSLTAVPAGASPVRSAVAPVFARQPTGQPGAPDTSSQPGPTVFVEVSPSMVEPGHLVGLRASCHDNSVGAIVVSDAFGRVAVQPQRGLLTGTAMIKERVLPGNYRAKLECRGGETASTMIQVVRQVKPSRGPATGFGGGARDITANLLLPGGLALTVTGMVLWITATRRRGSPR